MNVFVISALAEDTPMSETFKGVMPFFVAEIFRVAVLVAFPAITLWLRWFLPLASHRPGPLSES